MAGGAVAGGVVWMDCRPSCRTSSPELPDEFPEFPEFEVAPGATCVLPSDSIVCFVAPSTFCSVTPHCASTSLYT